MAAPVTDRGEWFGAARARAWATVLILVSALTLLGLSVETQGGGTADPWGRPLAPDFSSFWTAARMALQGDAASVWDPARHRLAQRALFPVAAGYRDDYYGFFYPPSFLVVLLPFGMLPYGIAVWAWVAATGAAFLTAMRRLLPQAWSAVLAGLAFPAVLVNAEHGQNGALSAALLAGGAVWLDRRPVLAGLCLGALSVKPQLALLVIPALLAARRWRALAGAGLGGGGLCVVSWLLFGRAGWRAFLADGAFALETLERGWVGYGKMVSSFAGARLLGAGLPAAWAVQAAVTVAAALVVLAVSRRRPGGAAEMAAVGVAACLVTPFVLDYDLMLLSVPLAWMVAAADRTGFRAGEKPCMAAAFALPLLVRPVAMQSGVPTAPVVLAGMLWLVWARVRSRPGGGSVRAAVPRRVDGEAPAG